MEEIRFDPSINIFQKKDTQFNKLFFPKNVALIGASEKENSVGKTILWNLFCKKQPWTY